MSLRGDLREAGIADEHLGAVEAVVRRYLADEYVPLNRFNELNDKNKQFAEQLKAAQAAQKEAEDKAIKAESDMTALSEQLTQTESDWLTRYTELEDAHRQEAEDRALLETYNARTSAIRDYIKDTAYDTDMVMSLIDYDALTVEDGKVLGVDTAIAALKKDKAFLFKGEEPVVSTAPTSAPVDPSKINFGEALAKRASEADAIVAAATEKYFGQK